MARLFNVFAIPSGLMGLAMSESTQEDAGLASGLVSTTSQAGGALGLAVLATLSNNRTADLLLKGVSEKQRRDRIESELIDRLFAQVKALAENG